jgi:hypothetical protein
MGDLLSWFGGALAVGAIWALFKLYEVLRARQHKEIMRSIRFDPAPEYDPEPERAPGETRISTGKFDRNPKMRRVRQYKQDEDGNDPFRN